MSKTKTLLAFAVMAAVAITPFSSVQAQEVELPVQTEIVIDTQSQASVLRHELADLKTKENDPSLGAFGKFIIRLKIRQLENQLNIKKALE